MKNSEATFQTEKIGEIEVDTGTLIIIDPCRMEEVSGLPLSQLLEGGQVCGPYRDGLPRKTAVISPTGLGDGRYPVFARTMTIPEWGKRVVQIIIDFNFDYCFAEDPRVKKQIEKREKEFLKIENS